MDMSCHWFVYLPIFFCHGHYWLVYQLVLSVVDKNGWYINRFCLSWTILVGKSIGFVGRGQYWSFMDNIGWYINRFCLSWTILVGKSIGFVCRGQYWLVYLPVLSVVDNIGWCIKVLFVVDNNGWFIN